MDQYFGRLCKSPPSEHKRWHRQLPLPSSLISLLLTALPSNLPSNQAISFWTPGWAQMTLKGKLVLVFAWMSPLSVHVLGPTPNLPSVITLLHFTASDTPLSSEAPKYVGVKEHDASPDSSSTSDLLTSFFPSSCTSLLLTALSPALPSNQATLPAMRG